MTILSGILTGIIETFAIIFIMKRWSLVFERKVLLCIGITTASMLLSILMFQNKYSLSTRINIITVYVIVFVIAGIDYKTRTIPNIILVFGMGIRAILYVVEAVSSVETIKDSLISAVLGFLFGLIFLLILSAITKRGIGYGDVKMFAWLGFCVGIRDVYSIMFYSAFAAAIFGLFLIFVKKADTKREIPFAPAVLVGTYMVFCMAFLE